ncbi:hypothetical protein [Tistrella sp.]|jgi:hypothetical protein|uniref:hypothetical protein n=1 Tax=Tistrella sp. TaxID=2024861 RepID=UPI0025F09E73|nr:hypothetical protein [Tistrella sp.]
MLVCALEKDGIEPEDVVVISARKINDPWLDKFGYHLAYPAKPRQTLLGQWPFISFYRSAARLIREAINARELSHVYIVNIENLLTNHLLLMTAERQDVEVALVVEGIFNFQEITPRNRARWRWVVKPSLARLLGLRWHTPVGHLSGAFEPGICRVVSFTEIGLKAPADKVDVLAWQPVRPSVVPDPRALVVVHTGLWQWMDQDAYLHVARAFVRWVERENFTRIIVKHHPHVGPGALEEMLPPHETWDTRASMENLASEVPAVTVAGTCCTALVTLKMLRPDLRCIDVGADFYCEAAYHGDHSVEHLLMGAGVEVVSIGRPG